MSVITTSTCIPWVKARYSAAVSAQRGVRMRSTMGSLDKFRNMVTRARAPDSSKLRRKYSATSLVTPMAQNTTPNFSSLPASSLSLAWRTIWAARRLWLMPLPEKMGSFWPRISVISTSMLLMPVRM